jgi:hypothetical protein
MSLHPDSAYCHRCGGVDVTGMGKLGRDYSARCRCDEEAERLTDVEVKELPNGGFRVAA